MNHKSKRTRTLLRKAMEVAKMCNLDIHLVVHDIEYGKVTEYASTNLSGASFTLTMAQDLINKIKAVQQGRNYRMFTDLDYQSLQVQPRDKNISISIIDEFPEIPKATCPL